MYALFKIEVNKISLIVTIDSTINWVSLNLNNNDMGRVVLDPFILSIQKERQRKFTILFCQNSFKRFGYQSTV